MHLHTVVWAYAADAAASAVQASQSFAYAMTTTRIEEGVAVYGKSALKTQHFAGLAVLFHASEGGGPLGAIGSRVGGPRGRHGGRVPRPCPGSATAYDV